MTPWSDHILKWSARSPDRTFFSDGRDSISFSKFELSTREVAELLATNGLGISDRAILALPRSTSAVVCLAALLRQGVAGLSIERMQIAATFEVVRSFVRPRAIFCLAADQAVVTAAMSDFETIPIRFEHDSTSSYDILLILDRGNGIQPSPPELRWMLQTSGSTRTPRVVMISRNNLQQRAKGEVRDFCLSENAVLVNALSFSHDLGLNQLLSTITSGASMRIQSQPFPASILRTLSEPGVTGVTGIPLMWTQILALNSPPVRGLRYITVSGGTLPRRQLLELAQLFPDAEVIRTYGQTETFRTLICRDLENESQGMPIQDVVANINEAGELVHAGAGQMMGYFGDDMSAPDARGVRTGDLFQRKSDGFYYIGRNDDMIKRFEARFHLRELELVIAELNGVADAAVVAKPAPAGDTRQMLLKVFVQLRIGVTVASSDIVEFCKSNLASYKIPDEIVFVKSFPRTPSAKIDRKALLGMWPNEV